MASSCMSPTAREAPSGGCRSAAPAGVSTLVGNPDVQNCLFLFGDVDGVGREARLQHPLGVAYHDGRIYVADTYNDKIKADRSPPSCRHDLVGGADTGTSGPLLNEPGGLSFGGDKLYVADTNADRIQVIDLKTKKATILQLEGVTAPKTTAVQKER